jgi:serine/threonine protein kinase
LCFTGEHESCHEAAPASGIFPYPVALMNTNLEYLWHVVVIIDLLCKQNLVMQNVDHSAGDFIDLLQGLLKHDPASRLTAQEALKHPFLTEKSERRR